MATCYPTYGLSSPQRVVQVPVQKDYSRPLHVDCSIEYELPNAAKPPQGVKNEPLLMIHPFYFRKMESQRRSTFVNNLPPPRTTVAVKRRSPRGQQQAPQQVPQQVAQYPVHYTATGAAESYLWDNISSLVPITSSSSAAAAAAVTPAAYNTRRPPTYCSSGSDSGHWTDPDRSPEHPPENKLMYHGKYRQCVKTHRLHPYVGSAIALGPAFPQIHQVCYNV